MSNPVEIPASTLEAIFRRAAVDAEYRARLLREPNAAITDVAPGVLRAGASVTFIERPATIDALFVLPDFASQQELSEAELEAVAGGLDAECGCDYQKLITASF